MISGEKALGDRWGRVDPIPQARFTVGVEVSFPAIKGLPRDSKMPARSGDISSLREPFLEHPASPRPEACLLCLCHRFSPLGFLPREENEICYRCLGLLQT
jgi:hypothetical protein